MIISVVGGGGKTTVGCKIAYELSCKGWRTLFTTTTKILHPGKGSVYIGPAKYLTADNLLMTAAKAQLPHGKLLGYTPDEMTQLPPLFDCIITEADGSARKPVKAPNETEPVYPLHTKIVIGVIGLDCLWKPITDEFVHRADLFADVTESNAGDIITAQHWLRLIKHPKGLFKGAPQEARKIVFLNKSDMINTSVKNEIAMALEKSAVPMLFTSREEAWFTEFYAWMKEGEV